jgi:hypothetical protein
MGEKFIIYFVIAFLSFCIGGWVGASFALGYAKTKAGDMVKRSRDE